MSRLRKLIPLSILIMVLSACVIVVFKHQDIEDWLRLRNYQPPSEIVKIADETSMTSYGRRLFYVYRPVFQDSDAFHQNCNDNEQTIVLGCYISDRGIYLFDVTDERLAGVEQVTAAHEMLHVGYERLSKNDRSKINALLQREFTSLADSRIKEVVELYRNKDPEVVPNELHSIMATEVSGLSPELEKYYSRYFSDRSKIVEYSKKYESEFSRRKNRIAELETTLEALRQKLDQVQNTATLQRTILDSERIRLDELLGAGRISEYNSSISSYNSKVSGYNASVDSLRGLINDYNKIVEEYNQLAAEQKELVEAIDSRVVPSEVQ